MHVRGRGQWIALLLAAAFAVGLLVAALRTPASSVSAEARPQSMEALAVGDALNPPRAVPAFALRDDRGRPTSLGAFRGRWVVLAPAMTLCHEVCPMTTGAFEELVTGLREEGPAGKVAVAEVTVDPWRDTPRRLQAYRRLSGADFSLLTGSRAQIARLWRFFGVYFQRVAAGTPPGMDWLTGRPERFDVQHTNALFILDPDGRERVVDEGMPLLGGALPKGLRRLLDAEGRENLAHPQSPWSAGQVLDDLAHLGLAETGIAAYRALAGAARSRTRSHSSDGNAAPSRVPHPAEDPPPPLAALRRQGGELLGGDAALRNRLGRLRGYPVLLNAWASWCPPCRAELPMIGAAARSYGDRVAFLGADTEDSQGPARRLTDTDRTPYPSYQTSLGDLDRLAPVSGTPTTVFLDPAGVPVHLHVGPYASRAELDGDIERYALGS